MWDENKQRRLDALREKELAGTLTNPEQRQLEELFAELDQAEEEMLGPFFERSDRERQQMREEIARLRERNAAIAAIAEQEEELLRHAKEQLRKLIHERQRLHAEYERVLGEERHAS